MDFKSNRTQISNMKQMLQVDHKIQTDLEGCIMAAWLNLVAQSVDSYAADDWLSLCPDIDEGEIYRDWFIWYDAEVAQEWEAYDPLTNQRYVHPNLAILKAQVDEVERKRSSVGAAA